jgi:hypothetical protein
LDDFLGEDRFYVLCIDTMGQDREFTEEERAFALEYAELFRASWEQREKAQLHYDLEQRVKFIKAPDLQAYQRRYEEEIKQIERRFMESQADDFIMDDKEDMKLSAIKQNELAKLFHKGQGLHSLITEIS